jgi:hypothetical protein
MKKKNIIIIILTIVVGLSIGIKLFQNPNKLGYDEFIEIKTKVFNELDNKYTKIDSSLDKANVATAYYGNKDHSWSKDDGDVLDQHFDKARKFKRYYIDESDKLLTLIEFQYTPELDERGYLSVRNLDAKDSAFFDKEYNLPFIYSNAFMDKGIYIEISTIYVGYDTMDSDLDKIRMEVAPILNNITNDVQSLLLDINS